MNGFHTVMNRLIFGLTCFRQARVGQSVSRNLRLDPAMVEMLQRTSYDFRSEGE
jgi:hypothetical protein